MNDLRRYCQLALKLARVVKLDGDEGYVAKIPGFRGLIATGENKRETLKELSGALEAWVLLALRSGMGLAKLKLAKEVTA